MQAGLTVTPPLPNGDTVTPDLLFIHAITPPLPNGDTMTPAQPHGVPTALVLSKQRCQGWAIGSGKQGTQEMGDVLAKGKGHQTECGRTRGGIVCQAEEAHSVSPPAHRAHKAILPVPGPFGQPRTD